MSHTPLNPATPNDRPVRLLRTGSTGRVARGGLGMLGVAVAFGVGLAASTPEVHADDSATTPAASRFSGVPPTLSAAYHEAVDPVLGDNEVLKALLGGTPQLDLRMAYEHKDFDDATNKDAANELSLRSRLSYTTGKIADSSGFIQVQNNWNIVEDFRWPGGGDAGHDIIADPDGTRLQQAYVDLGFIPDLKVRLGLQEINLDDQRLIGSVGWRQNSQSFNGVAATYTGIENLELYGAYLWDSYNILLRNDPDLEHLILTRAQYTFNKAVTASAFMYLTDFDQGGGDIATYGARVWGTWEHFTYDATGALQSDYQDGKHNGSFGSLYVGTAAFPVNVGAGYQYISGGTDGSSFDTLFGTAHKFNGWGDEFLATNGGGLPGGLQDYYLQATSEYQGFKATAQYHYFATTDELANGFDGEYGQEFDFDVTKKLSKSLSAELKYAAYMEGPDAVINPTTDEQVLMLRLQFTY